MELHYILLGIIYLLLMIIYFILLDELIMSYAQIRIGPFNLGYYGLFSSLINGCNFIISQYLIPKIYINSLFLVFQSFPLLFLLFSLLLYILIYPFFLVDIYLSLILFLFISSLSIFFIILTAFSSCSKYSYLGSIRIISQLIAFELLTSTIILLYSFSFNWLSINYY